MDPANVLRAYAELTDDTGPAPVPRNVLAVRSEFAVYPFGAHIIFEGKRHGAQLLLGVEKYRPVERIVATAQLERGTGSQLRLGWLWFSGTTVVEEEKVTWCFPALSAPVARARSFLGTNKGLEQVGDAEITPLVTDESVREQLLASAQFGGGALMERAWVDTSFHDTGYEAADPRTLPRLDRLNSWARDVAQAVGIETSPLELAEDDRPSTEKTNKGIRAFACFGLYFDPGKQYSSSRRDLEELVRLEGLDSTAFATVHGGEVTAEERKYVHQIGPFSSRQQTAAESIKASSLSVMSGPPGTGKTHLLAVTATDAVAWGKSVLVVASSKHATDVLVDYLADMPGPTPVAFDGSARARDLAYELIEHAGAKPARTDDSEQVIENFTRLENEFAERFAQLASGSQVDLEPTLDEIHGQEAVLADAFGDAFIKLWLNPLTTKQRMMLREIGYSLSSTRTERAEALGEADPKDLTAAAPLWVGTLEDVEKILPVAAGMFDLVIFDEAAQICPIEASGSLVRAKRAIVCGDPIQLGHTSFLSNDQIRSVAEQYDLDAETIDPRSQSLFEMAASRVPVTAIDEHYRSAPHLIEFSARRFYGSQLQVMTRHPKNQDADHIDVEFVDGRRNSSKVNTIEVDRCIELVDTFLTQGWKSIGVISPFRAQSDAIEEAMLSKFSLAQIDGGLRVGTVHGFQGDECDVIITSWAIGDDEGDRAWSFINQPKLFNVMVTRAREQMVVVTSTTKPPGLAGEYIRWGDPLVDLLGDAGVDHHWPEEVARALEYAGVHVRRGYRVGHHIVDLVVGPAEHAVAIDCLAHSEGADAHLDRALHLRRMGWNTTEAFDVEWGNNTAGLVVDLLRRFPAIRQSVS